MNHSKFGRTSTNLKWEELDSEDEELEDGLNELWERTKLGISSAFHLKFIANALFVIGISFVCFNQCYIQIKEYLDYPEQIQVVHSRPSSTLWMMPGLTICNNNRVRIDRLLNNRPHLNALLNGYTKVSKEEIALYPKQERYAIMSDIKKLLDANLNITSLLLNSTMSELIELSSFPIVKDLNCNVLWGRQFNCENFRIIESYQARSCYTLFHIGAIEEGLSNGLAYRFNTSLIGGLTKVTPFETNELAELFVDFQPFEVADFRNDPGGSLIVHSTNHIGSIQEMAYSLLPGRKYDIIIQKMSKKRLPAPYKTNCRDYKGQNLPLFRNQANASGSIELDRATCLKNCLADQATFKCKCWPIEVPLFPGDKRINNSHELRLCPWGYRQMLNEDSVDLYARCLRSNIAPCAKKCRPNCQAEEFRTQVISESWPTSTMFLSSATQKDRLELKRLEACCARISIKYLNLMETRYIWMADVTFVQLVSNLGGIVSALVGVSAITVYRFLTRQVLQCRVVSDYKPSLVWKSNKSGQTGGRRIKLAAIRAHRLSRVHPCSVQPALVETTNGDSVYSGGGWA